MQQQQGHHIKSFLACRAPVGGLVLALVLAVGCGSDDGEGTGKLSITTWGEDYIEKEIPSSEISGGATVRFSKFLVALSAVRVADASGSLGGEATLQRIFDMVAPGPHEVASFDAMGAKRWDRVGVEIAPAKGAAAGNANVADVELMNQGGHSVYIEGSITPPTGGASSKPLSFAWGFATATRYEKCEDAEGKLGVVVPTGGNATAQLTVHGDHFFYDSLQGDAVLRVEALFGADSAGDGDGAVTLAELAAVDLTSLPSEQYDTAGDGSINDLRAFVTALTRTLVHFQGEGHCHASPL